MSGATARMTATEKHRDEMLTASFATAPPARDAASRQKYVDFYHGIRPDVPLPLVRKIAEAVNHERSYADWKNRLTSEALREELKKSLREPTKHQMKNEILTLLVKNLKTKNLELEETAATLKAENDGLKAQNRELEKYLRTCIASERGRAEIAEEIIAIKKEKIEECMECPVCMEASADVALVPCGHRICGSCADDAAKNSPNLCFTCSRHVVATAKLYNLPSLTMP